jgi:hypothetical protein
MMGHSRQVEADGRCSHRLPECGLRTHHCRCIAAGAEGGAFVIDQLEDELDYNFVFWKLIPI